MDMHSGHYCTRCRKVNRYRIAWPFLVGAFPGDRKPVRATLCNPCEQAVKASRATIVEAPASWLETR